jgi:hypothetical protein
MKLTKIEIDSVDNEFDNTKKTSADGKKKRNTNYT